MVKKCLTIVAGLFAAMLAATCVSARPDQPQQVVAVSDPETVWLRVETADGNVVPLPLDEYVRGGVLPEAALAELEPATALRVAQVQAILARTYALSNRQRHGDDGFDLCSTTHCQVYRPLRGWPEHLVRLSEEAVRSTSGTVVVYGGTPINAVFHADCGGHTSDAGTVWRGSNPTYLRGLPDPFCLRRRRTPWRFEVAVAALRRALNRDVHTAVGAYLDDVVVTERDAAGRAAQVTLVGQHTVVVRGEQLRGALALFDGTPSIRSARFTVRQSDGVVVFEGRGFGHGVGLCQTGAMVRARAGHSPHDILMHYYPGTTLASWHDAPFQTQ